jgi:hypothetical protein
MMDYGSFVLTKKSECRFVLYGDPLKMGLHKGTNHPLFFFYRKNKKQFFDFLDLQPRKMP